MIKLKDILNEKGIELGRVYTDKDLPPFQTPQQLTEVDFEKVKIPSQVKRFLDKFVDSVKAAGLNRIKRSAVLYQVIDAMGMSPQTLVKDIQKIKKGLGEGKDGR